MKSWQRLIKRAFDLCLAIVCIAIFWWLILLCWIVAAIDTRQNGFFRQSRVGMHGRIFGIWKFRTMRPIDGLTSNVTTRKDPRVTRIGKLLRRYKLDELPQLFNVLAGQMSFVGPRPDVSEYADLISEADRIILSVRPGITGIATLVYRDEEALLAEMENPEHYNQYVIFPDKIKLNRYYLENYSFRADILMLLATVLPDWQRWLMSKYEHELDLDFANLRAVSILATNPDLDLGGVVDNPPQPRANPKIMVPDKISRSVG